MIRLDELSKWFGEVQGLQDRVGVAAREIAVSMRCDGAWWGKGRHRAPDVAELRTAQHHKGQHGSVRSQADRQRAVSPWPTTDPLLGVWTRGGEGTRKGETHILHAKVALSWRLRMPLYARLRSSCRSRRWRTGGRLRGALPAPQERHRCSGGTALGRAWTAERATGVTARAARAPLTCRGKRPMKRAGGGASRGVQGQDRPALWTTLPAGFSVPRRRAHGCRARSERDTIAPTLPPLAPTEPGPELRHHSAAVRHAVGAKGQVATVLRDRPLPRSLSREHWRPPPSRPSQPRARAIRSKQRVCNA